MMFSSTPISNGNSKVIDRERESFTVEFEWIKTPIRADMHRRVLCYCDQINIYENDNSK